MGAELPAIVGLSGISVIFAYLSVKIPESLDISNRIKPLQILFLMFSIFTILICLEIVADETSISLIETEYIAVVWVMRIILAVIFIDFLWEVLNMWTGSRRRSYYER